MGKGTADLRAARTGPHITPDHQAVQWPTTGETGTVPPRTYHGSRQKQERYPRPLRCAGESSPVEHGPQLTGHTDKSLKLYGHYVQEHIQILCRVSALL